MKSTWLLMLALLLSGVSCGDDDSESVEEGTGGTGGKSGSGGRIGTGGRSGAPAAGSVSSEADGGSETSQSFANDPTTAYVGGAAIGVSDLDASQKFYSEVLGMTLRYEVDVPNYAAERILYFEESKGADVVLMNFHDGQDHNYQKNPVKLVFYVPNAKDTIEAIRDRGLEITTEPTPQASFNNAVIGLGRDPDGYIIEIIESQSLKVPYLGAIGIGVSDLDKAKDFYTRVLGMNTMGDLIQVANVWDEWILQYQSGQGSSIVLLHYTDGKEHDYANLPIKTAHFVDDSRALIGKIEADGFKVSSQPSIFDLNGSPALIGLTRDPDGYTVELITPQ